MDGGEFFEPESLYAMMIKRFQIRYYFECCSKLIDVHFRFGFFESFKLFFHVAYPFNYFVIFSWLPYFALK